MNKNEIVEIIDVNGDSLSKAKSGVEQNIQVDGYNDLLRKIEALQIDKNMPFGDGKIYSPEVGQIVWRTVLLSATPIIPKNQYEKDLLQKIYKLILSLTYSGEYPLMQLLTNYLGVTINEFIYILNDTKDDRQEIFMWAYKVFEAGAQLNSIRSNGNPQARQWIDKTREGKIAVEEAMKIELERDNLSIIKERGKAIAMEIEEDLYGE